VALPGFVKNVIDEVKRTPGNVAKGVAALESRIPGAAGLVGALAGGPLGLVIANQLRHPPMGKGKRGPRPVHEMDDDEMPDVCRVGKANGAVITDEAEVIYDYKAVTGAQTASGVDIFDDTTTTNITEAKKVPAGLYKEVSCTVEVNNAADTLGMVVDAIIRMKSGKNGDITWERRLADLSDFLLIDTAHGTFLRQDAQHSEDADIVVVDENALNYFNILFPSIPTFTGTAKVNLALRKFPLPKSMR